MQLITDDYIDPDFGFAPNMLGQILVHVHRHQEGPAAGYVGGFLTLSPENFRMLKTKTPEERAELGWGDYEQDFINNDF